MNEVLEDAAHLAKRVVQYSFIGWVVALFMMLRLPGKDDIDHALLKPPMQYQIHQPDLHFNYMGQDIRVIPVMEYEINGLIVSQHDPSKWYSFDLTRREDSINTRDICLIWGSNLTNNQYRNVGFHNDDAICHWSYGKSVTKFNEQEVSNNHLITANDRIRRQIETLYAGDQVAIKGKLVYYAEGRVPGLVYQSSLTRTDTGKAGAEIILVESLSIIDSHNWVWALLRDICFWLCVLGVSVIVSIFIVPRRGLYLPKWLRHIISLYKA